LRPVGDESLAALAERRASAPAATTEATPNFGKMSLEARVYSCCQWFRRAMVRVAHGKGASESTRMGWLQSVPGAWMPVVVKLVPPTGTLPLPVLPRCAAG
jgi:hypothetical protein